MNQNFFYALTIGSDIGIFKDSYNPTMKRFLEYGTLCGMHFTLCYTPRGYRPLTIGRRLKIFPTNSRHKLFFLKDGVIKGLKIIGKYHPRVIVAQDTFIFGLVGLILKKITRLPLVVHYHSGFYTNSYWLSERRTHRWLAKLGVFVSKRADVIRTVSTDIQKDLLKNGLHPKRVYYATPPVDDAAFSKKEADKEKIILDKYKLERAKTFVFIGRLSKEKNLSLLLRAVAALSINYFDLKVLIIGEGPEEALLRRLAHQYRITDHIIFVGSIPYIEIKDHIRVACALLITSYYEGTAKVIKEAAFAGRAAISTRTSGVRDAVKDGETGLIIPIDDLQALTESMEFFLRNPGETQKMGQRAKEFVECMFDYQKDVNRIVEIWKQALIR